MLKLFKLALAYFLLKLMEDSYNYSFYFHFKLAPFLSAEYLMRIPGLKILRIYGNVIEEKEFPIPNQVTQTRNTGLYDVPENLMSVALHHVIRDVSKSPYAQELKSLEKKFARLKRQMKKIKDKHVDRYQKVWTA